MAVRDTSALWAPVPQKSAHGKTASGKQTGNQAGGWGHGKRTWSSSSQPFRIGRSVPEWHPSAVGPQRAHAQSPPQAQGLRAVGRGGGGLAKGKTVFDHLLGSEGGGPDMGSWGVAEGSGRPAQPCSPGHFL